MPSLPHKLLTQITIFKRPLINNRIRAREVRLIDETGKNLGVLGLSEALRKAWSRNLDLVQVTEKVEPPICKITDYGKYIYQLEKKEKKARKARVELKGIRLKYNISSHDLETRVRQAEKFLKKGNPVRIEMNLRGRERALQDFANEKINQFLEMLRAGMPIKIEQELKRRPRGLTMIISKT